MALVPWFLAAYLVGAIPTSYLAGRLRGIDLRQQGSKNLGATNVYRVLGWRYAVPVALVDIAKGVIPVTLFGARAGGGPVVSLLLGLTAVIGHVFSVFVRFRGGKGVATGAGILLGYLPAAFGGALVVWGLALWVTGYVSVASILAALLFPVAAWVFHPEARETVWLQVLLAAAVVVLHRANLRRLLAGTEHRFGRRGRAALEERP